MTLTFHAILIAASVIFNREPLQETRYAELPIGSIQPQGWLLEQLKRQASGLTGHLDEVYPEVMGESNAWLGGDGDAWERGPYWIDGLLPLAYILNDETLKAKAQKWVEAILSSQQENGYFGPAKSNPYVYGLQRGKAKDWWPKMVGLKIMKQYYMATGDKRVIDFMTKYFRYQAETLPTQPLDNWSHWGKERGGDNLEIVYWLYNITGEEWLLELGELIHSQSTDWASLFRDGNIFMEQNSVHCVNLAQGFKAPIVWWQYSHYDGDLFAARHAADIIRTTVGLPTGLWGGDEQLHFGTPTRGSELCTAVEMMFSLEEMLRISGDLFWADYLERVAFNALPTQANDDFTAKQYYQQSNQIMATRAWRPFSTPHYGTDILYGTMNGYPCCLSNMHQGWPKLTQNLWYAADDGIAALVYAPSCVTATLPNGVTVKITETTDYPFRGKVHFKIDFPGKKVKVADFVFHLRVPSWSKGAIVSVNGVKQDSPAGKNNVNIKRSWKKGDVVEIEFHEELTTEKWWDGAWVFTRGPLVYALKMEEKWSWINFDGPDKYFGKGAWEVTSPTPWNYCIMRDKFKTEDCTVEVTQQMPVYPWNIENAPIRITVPARTLPCWTEYNGSVGEIPYFTESSGTDSGEDVTIELVPYGCTTLRIAQFPTRIVPWDLKYREDLL